AAYPTSLMSLARSAPPPFPYTTLFRSPVTFFPVRLFNLWARCSALCVILGRARGLLPVSGTLSVRLRRALRRSEALRGELLRTRSEEHTSELQSRENLVCPPLLGQKHL